MRRGAQSIAKRRACQSQGGKYQELLLIDHSADVASCFTALIQYDPLNDTCGPSVLRKRLARLAGRHDLHPAQCARLVVFAALHDFGKANHGFQRRILEVSEGRTAGHVGEALGLLCHVAEDEWRERLAGIFDFDKLARWFKKSDDALCFFSAAICHHGRVVKPNEQAASALWLAREGYDPLGEVAKLVRATRTWLPAAWGTASDCIPSHPALQHAFCGVLQLADWLGSDPEFFPFPGKGGCPSHPERWIWSCGRARKAVEAIGFSASGVRPCLGNEPSFQSLFQEHPSPPRPMQAAVGCLEAPLAASVALIEDETGAGKTEAALWYFLRMLSSGLVDGLYFALPTRAAALQIFERVRSAWRAACGDKAPAVVCAVPGYLRADDAEGRRLPEFKVLWNDDPKERKRHRYWAAERPKRYLAGSIAVGTIDQVLLSGLAVPHHHLRAAPLLRHLLVVDEVHASDSYMAAVLREVLKRHVEAGGQALLLSATLGSCAAAKLLHPARKEQVPPPLKDALALPYPLLRRAGASWEVMPVQTVLPPRAVHVRCEPVMGNPDAIARIALKHAASGARVLVIRNTVTNCLKTWRSMERTKEATLGFAVETPRGRVRCPHHGRYARADRLLLDRGLEAAFGKDAARGGSGCVLVATQTVEQSLDIDADLLVTDLCPADVLLQRLGRMHRHERSRPAGFEKPAAVVLVPDVADLGVFLDERGRTPATAGALGLGSVYEDLRVLQATWECLNDASFRPLRIPGQNRALVERCTHPEALAAFDARSPAWKRHGESVLGVRILHRQLAGLNLLPWTVAFRLWDLEALEKLHPPGKLEQRVRTRLGLEDRRMTLPGGTTSPLGQVIRELSLPGHWFTWRPLPLREEPDEVKEANNALAIRVGDWHFRYSACGLERAAPGSGAP